MAFYFRVNAVLTSYSVITKALYSVLLILISFNAAPNGIVLGRRIGNISTTGIMDNSFCDNWSMESDMETLVLWATDGYCNLLVSAERGTNIAVQIVDYTREDILQYIYVERVDVEDESKNCERNILVYPTKLKPCITLLEHSTFRLHAIANVTMLIRTFNNDEVSTPLTCPESKSDEPCMEPEICSENDYYCTNLSVVDNYTRCAFSSFPNDEYEYPGIEGTLCTVHCPESCECSLHNRELRATCSAGDFRNLIVYPVDTTVLNLAHNRLGQLETNAFGALRRVAKLFLHNTNITDIKPGAFNGMDNLRLLTLSYNSGIKLRPGSFQVLRNLKEFYLSNNTLSEITPSVFDGIENVYFLFLAKNNFHTLDATGISELDKLKVLDMANNSLRELPADFCLRHPDIVYVNLANNSMQKLSARMFKNCSSLETLNLNGNDLKWISKDSFVGIRNISKILVDNYYTCCFVTNGTCTAQRPRPEFLTCKRLLPHDILRVCMWILGICALFGNLMVIWWRCRERNDTNKVQSLLITNLSLSDFLMGVYMLILTFADAYFQDFFPSHADRWRSGLICKFAGLIAMLSSEASVFFLVLISIDRLIGVKYPFSTRKLTPKTTRIVATILWIIALIMGMVATLLTGTDYYDVSEVCIGLPLARKTVTKAEIRTVNISSSHEEQKIDVAILSDIGSKPGMYFSIVIFIGVNTVCFIVIALCYVIIFVTFHESTKRSVRRQEREEEIKMAGKMAVIVVTDFLCWMPVVIMSILVQTGAVTLSPEITAWTVTFILPINSSVNPFLYTISTVVSSRLSQRKSRIYANSTLESQHN